MQIGLGVGITFPRPLIGGWSPLDIASLRDWWKISDTSTITQAGGTASAVAGQAGNLNLAQGTPSAQPATGGTIGTNAIHALSFNSTSQFLAAAATIPQPFTVATIAQSTSASLQQALWSFDGSTINNWFGIQSTNTWRAHLGNFSNLSAATDTNAHVLILTVSGGVGTLYIDGTLVATNSPGANSITALRLGLRGDGNQGWSGKASDSALFSAVLSTEDRTSLNSYLRDLAGI